MKKSAPLERRYRNTLEFISGNIDKEENILDLGVVNALSSKLSDLGYMVENTKGEDLDLEPDILTRYGKYDAVTAFEILEHLVSPFVLLKKLPAKKLLATVPLDLWFSKAYRSKEDERNRHFHEFEDWQFDWLLEKAGWKIIKREKWTSFANEFGIRPFMRKFYPRYYAVYAERV